MEDVFLRQGIEIYIAGEQEKVPNQTVEVKNLLIAGT